MAEQLQWTSTVMIGTWLVDHMLVWGLLRVGAAAPGCCCMGRGA